MQLLQTYHTHIHTHKHTNVQTTHLLYLLSLCSLSGNESVSCLSFTELLLNIVVFPFNCMCVTVYECWSHTVTEAHTHTHTHTHKYNYTLASTTESLFYLKISFYLERKLEKYFLWHKLKQWRRNITNMALKQLCNSTSKRIIEAKHIRNVLSRLLYNREKTVRKIKKHVK